MREKAPLLKGQNICTLGNEKQIQSNHKQKPNYSFFTGTTRISKRVLLNTDKLILIKVSF